VFENILEVLNNQFRGDKAARVNPSKGRAKRVNEKLKHDIGGIRFYNPPVLSRSVHGDTATSWKGVLEYGSEVGTK
jgi:hypothetical protein